MRKLYFAASVALFLAMICVFIPTVQQRAAMWTTSDNLRAADIIPYDQAHDRARALLKIVREEPVDGLIYFKALKEYHTLQAFKEKDDDFDEYRDFPKHRNRVALSTLLDGGWNNFNGWVTKMQGHPEQFEIARKLFESDGEFKRAHAFKRYTTQYRWAAIAEYLEFKFFCMIPLSGLFYLALLLRRSGEIKPVLELGNPMFYLAVLTGPFGLMFYSAEARQQTKRAIRWVSYATAAAVSAFCGAPAQAQTVKPDNGKKPKAASALQIDFKNVDFVGDAPGTKTLRASVYSGRFMADSITSVTPETSGWYSETAAGVFLKKTKATWLMGIGAVTANNLGRKNAVAGLQFLRYGKWYTLAFPAIRYEHSIAGPPAKSLCLVTNPVFRFGSIGIRNRVGLAPEVNLKKTLGKPLAWTLGSAVRVFPGKAKKNSVELGAFRNQLGQWSVRSRFTLNYAF